MKKKRIFIILISFLFKLYMVNLFTIGFALGIYIRINRTGIINSTNEFVFLVIGMAICCLFTTFLFLTLYEKFHIQKELTEKWLLEKSKSIISTITLFIAVFSKFANLTLVDDSAATFVSMLFSFETFSVLLGFLTLSTNMIYLFKYDLTKE
ncbi:hypothetical protein [Enterococcus sp. AZ103]|uniref:hypothetical protein n=1 Tax=Enterococcus sp. AZ103 TaxID=2774628 RepID=UPI003F29BE42